MTPSGYWKILALELAGAIKIQAFITDQDTPRSADYCDHRVSVDEVENRSGLEFFHELSQGEQDPLERGTGTLVVELGCTP